MLSAWSYDRIIEELTSSFESSLKSTSDPGVKLVGLLFARPNAALGKGEIIPSIDYFHHRSGASIDFFCAGYRRFGRREYDDEVAVTTGEDPWYFSNIAFNKLRDQVANRTTWSYSGEADLLLLDSIFDEQTQTATLSWDAAIIGDLDLMLRNEAITSVHRYFEDIFKFAEDYNGKSPTKSFSGNRSLTVAGSALKKVALAAIPGEVGNDVENLGFFSARNVNRD